MPVKRRISGPESEDPNFERDRSRIADAVALHARIESYPKPPEPVAGDSVSSQLAYSRALIAYEAQRAVDLGVLFEPSCAKCGVKKECTVDISTLVGRRRTFRCQSCIVGKIACGNASRAVEANERWRRYLAMGQGCGDLGREWQERVAAQPARDRGRKQARIDQEETLSHKRLDQVSMRAVPYVF